MDLLSAVKILPDRKSNDQPPALPVGYRFWYFFVITNSISLISASLNFAISLVISFNSFALMK
jgi:hypothetical protein